jgi:hypothetical protein
MTVDHRHSRGIFDPLNEIRGSCGTMDYHFSFTWRRPTDAPTLVDTFAGHPRDGAAVLSICGCAEFVRRAGTGYWRRAARQLDSGAVSRRPNDP